MCLLVVGVKMCVCPSVVLGCVLAHWWCSDMCVCPSVVFRCRCVPVSGVKMCVQFGGVDICVCWLVVL